MSLKAFFIDCSELVFAEVAEQLQKKEGWQVLYWSGGDDIQKKISQLFPSAVFHHVIQAVRNIPPAEMSSLSTRPPDQSLLHSLAPHETEVLKMMNRIGPDSVFSLAERLDVYHKYLAYWQAVLDKLQPQVVVFSIAPHLVYDYVIYLLCQHRGIPTVMFEFAPPLPHLLVAQQGFDKGLPQVIQRYQAKLAKRDGGTVELSPLSQQYLDRISRTYNDGAPWYVFKHRDKSNQYQSAYTWKSLLSSIAVPSKMFQLAKNFVNFLSDPPPQNYTKLPKKRLDQSNPTGLAWRINRQRRRWYKKRLNRYFGYLAKKVDIKQTYILVALHFQPERTTSPLGGRYVDQLLMIRLLSRWLPEGWRLYVKEAPAFFFPHVTKQSARNHNFYDEIARLPNAELVGPHADIFTLVDNAKAVATVTGTVGWEAVLRGKPALIFGHAWYKGCEGVHWAGDENACRAAIKAAQGGSVPDPAKVLLFLQSLEEVSIGACIMTHFRDLVHISDKENVLRLTHAVLDMAQSQLKN